MVTVRTLCPAYAVTYYPPYAVASTRSAGRFHRSKPASLFRPRPLRDNIEFLFKLPIPMAHSVGVGSLVCVGAHLSRAADPPRTDITGRVVGGGFQNFLHDASRMPNIGIVSH